MKSYAVSKVHTDLQTLWIQKSYLKQRQCLVVGIAGTADYNHRKCLKELMLSVAC